LVPGAAANGRRGGNPAVAFILGFLFPGLGAVYNGEYNKALIHIVVFATFVFGLSSDLDGGMKAVLGILLAGFIFYMAFDSMRTAEAQKRGEASADPLESWSKDRPVGPIILIVLGALFLLNNFNWFPFYQIERFWPLVLIAVGILMFRNRLSGRS
jgi:TM2 domain-containing membrane protein YozV